MDKIVVAPQIVIYKNIFKDSKNLISILETDSPNSLFSNWRDWYSQGRRKEAELTRSIYNDNNNLIPEEQKIMQDILSIMDFVQDDYFAEFSGDKGIWPDFIENWQQLYNKKDLLYIDFFQYDHTKVANNEETKIMMDYHVDEFMMPSDKKSKRHVITINLYLNNDYDGGEICAYDSISNKIYSFKPSPGDIIVMPSTEPFYHAVKNVNGADRYFLRTFIDYETNRKFDYTQEELDQMFDGMDNKEQEYVKNHLQSIKVSLSNGIEVVNV